jgi:predicted dehydrogenase
LKNLRIAVVGCGKIADQHLLAIRRISGAKVVGVCDSDTLMAEQFAERFKIDYFTNDFARLLIELKPDIVHITTPPQSHFALALQCLEAGSHVYLEKPFTIDTQEALSLIKVAEDLNLKITAGHNYQYAWESIEARKLVRSGYLGSRPVFIESYYSYNFNDDPYALALLGDQEHWVRKLPGGLLHNVISHAVARIAEYMNSRDPYVSVLAYTSPALKNRGETLVKDELRVNIFNGSNTSASLVFSSQVNPPTNKFRLYGTENSIEVDNFNRTIIRLKNNKLKSFARYFFQPVSFAKEYSRNSYNNISRFLLNKFHDDSGFNNLINAFYDAISGQRQPPISYREIILTSMIMDRIFEQLYNLNEQKK